MTLKELNEKAEEVVQDYNEWREDGEVKQDDIEFDMVEPHKAVACYEDASDDQDITETLCEWLSRHKVEYESDYEDAEGLVYIRVKVADV